MENNLLTFLRLLAVPALTLSMVALLLLGLVGLFTATTAWFGVEPLLALALLFIASWLTVKLEGIR